MARMQALFLVTVLLAIVQRPVDAKVASTASSSRNNNPKVIAEWNQCGGKGGDCAKFGGCKNDAPFAGYQCASGLDCKRQNEWYWQCLKGATPAPTPSPKPTPTPSPKPTPSSVIKRYDQCGGKGGNCKDFGGCENDAQYAGYRCESGTMCRRQNEWYWQCL